MKQLLLLFVTAALLSGFAFAQVTVSLPEITPSSENTSITIPVNVTGFTGIGAISLKFSYDSNVLTFQDAANLATPGFLVTAANGVLTIGWYSLTPLNLGSGKLLDLNFQYNSGTTNLNFITAQCEISNASGQQLTPSFQNGKILTTGGGNPQMASIGNKVWNDLNKNGIQDAGEPGLQWVTVELYDCNNVWKAWKFTDANGEFVFDNLEPGDYFLKFYLIDANSNFIFSPKDAGNNEELDSDVEVLSDSSAGTFCTTLSAGENDLSWDAGVFDNTAPVINNGSIGNIVWNDVNKNGIQDNGEPGVNNVTVNLINNNFEVLKSTTTNNNGNYLFSDLNAGTYGVEFILPSNYKFTAKNVGGDNTVDSDPDAAHGRVDPFALAEGENNLSIDAGIFEEVIVTPGLGIIADKVFIDENRNGIEDDGESGLPWVTVELFDCNNLWLDYTVTDGNGAFSFDSLESGSYYVKYYLIEGNAEYRFTTNNIIIIADTIGRTDCILISTGAPASGPQLAGALSSTSVKAGVCKGNPPVQFGSIGNFVWKDIDCDGIQDNGEPGIKDVTVKLLDCNLTELKSTQTDLNGNYLFSNLSEGTYCIKFILPSGYEFAPSKVGSDAAKDSDPDKTSGIAECFTLASGENKLSIDAGLCQIVTPPTNPVLWISKTDNLIEMPPVGSSTTYTISYKNEGTGVLYNAVIEDVLPKGVKLISASNGGTETFSGSNTVVFNLGTLNPNDNGSVTVNVEVNSEETEYLNVACLTGKDASNNLLEECAEDLNFCDSTSGGGGSGVESRGDMAELLLRREWKIRNGLTTPVLSKSGTGSITSQLSLQQLVPADGPYNSHAVETTPFDILGISNAVASYAVDYLLNTGASERRVGGVFSTITNAPNIYDHTKVVCDRLAGSAIEEIKLVEIDAYKFYAAKLRKTSGRITDYAISFSVYETASGFQVENKWTWEEYKSPFGASSVYNFQAWSSSYDGSVQLIRNILANLKSIGSVSFINQNQNVPDVFIKETRYSHDGKVHLTFINNADVSKQITLNSFMRFSQGDELIQSTSKYTVGSGETNVELPLGILSDAQVQLSQESGFKDEVFVSGGAYTYITGANTNVAEFKTSGYTQQNLSAYPEGTIMLSGGAYVSGRLNDWMTVIRALTTNGSSYDLSEHGQLRVEAKGNGVLTVMLDLTNVNNFNYFATNITLSQQSREYILNFSDFRQLLSNEVEFDASKIRAVGFIYNNVNNPGISNFNFEVKNIGFFKSGAATGNNNGSIPDKFDLAQNYPNPFNPSTVIDVSVANKELISLRVYDLLGQQVAQLVNEELEPGRYSFKFDASNLSSGVYFYKLHSSSVNITRKMTLTK